MPNPIVLELREGEGEAGFLQELAGQPLWSARPLLRRATAARRPRPAASPRETVWRPIYDGPGLIEGSLQRIVSWRGESGARRVDFEDGERFVVAADGGAIRRLSGPDSPAAAARTAERALGAPLALALAPRGTYLFHASALALEGIALALTAPSGGGKSTLAAVAARRGLARIADDLLPVRLGRSPVALPRFPQLKLADAPEAAREPPESLPFRALLEIQHSPTAPGVELVRYSTAAAALALTRATVAARLFDAELLAAHFQACAEAAEAMTVAKLSYPSGLDRLPAVLDALAELARQIG